MHRLASKGRKKTRSASAAVLGDVGESDCASSFCLRFPTHPLGTEHAAFGVSRGIKTLAKIRSQHPCGLNCSAQEQAQIRQQALRVWTALLILKTIFILVDK